jgi:hypothetical protein
MIHLRPGLVLACAALAVTSLCAVGCKQGDSSGPAAASNLPVKGPWDAIKITSANKKLPDGSPLFVVENTGGKTVKVIFMDFYGYDERRQPDVLGVQTLGPGPRDLVRAGGSTAGSVATTSNTSSRLGSLRRAEPFLPLSQALDQSDRTTRRQGSTKSGDVASMITMVQERRDARRHLATPRRVSAARTTPCTTK